MDLDALSGVVAYKHTGSDVTTVTAAFDRIELTNPLTEICDLELSGQVTYATGRSSMEISLQVAKAPKPGEKVKKEDILMQCSCTMVSLDPATKKYCTLPQWVNYFQTNVFILGRRTSTQSLLRPQRKKRCFEEARGTLRSVRK